MSEHNNKLSQRVTLHIRVFIFSKFTNIHQVHSIHGAPEFEHICAYLTVGYDYGVFAEYSEFRE
jgi:hypothetical protein